MKVEQVGRAYSVPVIDYQRDGSGLLISTGAGLMMATMDAVPNLRYCADLGGGNGDEKLGEFLIIASRLCSFFVFHGWFSISSPEVFVRAFLPHAGKTIWRSNSDNPAGCLVAADFSSLVDLARSYGNNLGIQDNRGASSKCANLAANR